MTNWFESITKTLADNKSSRRQMVKKAVGITVIAALTSVIPADEVFAASERMGHYCRLYGNCTSDFLNCEIKKYNNPNCICLQKLASNSGICGCNTYCASAPICSSQSSCPTDYACITNTACGCNVNLCIQKCNKTCTIAPNGAGRTAA